MQNGLKAVTSSVDILGFIEGKDLVAGRFPNCDLETFCKLIKYTLHTLFNIPIKLVKFIFLNMVTVNLGIRTFSHPLF